MIRDRIKELRRVKASELRPNPKNWRTHPAAQQDALRAVLNEVGYADAVLARECDDGTLMLIDGHLRAETTPDDLVPVLVLDVDEAEADKILLTHDPLAAMAEASYVHLGALLVGVTTDDASLSELLGNLRHDVERASLDFQQRGENDPAAEWVGMPECTSDNLMSWKSIKVHFADAEGLAAFALLVDQTVTEHTRSIWYPAAVRDKYDDVQYTDDA